MDQKLINGTEAHAKHKALSGLKNSDLVQCISVENNRKHDGKVVKQKTKNTSIQESKLSNGKPKQPDINKQTKTLIDFKISENKKLTEKKRTRKALRKKMGWKTF